MNIFATYNSAVQSAQSLPDKHIVKMPLETAQMLSLVYSHHYHSWGTLPKKDGSSFNTTKGAFSKHPCTIWVSESVENLEWMLQHGRALCREFEFRFGHVHSCEKAIQYAIKMFEDVAGRKLAHDSRLPSFARAMPDELKNDSTINDVTAYRRYMNTKIWVRENYIRKPERKPEWIV